MSGRGGGEVLGKSSSIGRRPMSADQSGCITSSPGGWGTVPPSQSPNKDGHDNFRARALLGSYSGSHSKCSIISDRVLKKPHVKTYEFEKRGDLHLTEVLCTLHALKKGHKILKEKCW